MNRITMFFDPSTQRTTGPRGKTTLRPDTHTVRGPEGAYIATIKEELCARPPVLKFDVVMEQQYPDSPKRTYRSYRFTDRQQAVDKITNIRHCPYTTYHVQEVWTVWLMVNGHLKNVDL